MAKEILAIPEENLEEVILVIRKGLTITYEVSKETIEQLNKWCDEEEKYLNKLKEG